MELDIRVKILITTAFLSISISAQTKPVVGRVVSDASIYLSDVAITSLPSSSTTKTDSSGFFSFDVPVKDRKIIFELDGYLSDTLNVILFINHEDIQLVKLVEIDYLDSVDTSIKFNVFNKEANVYEYDMLDMLFLGLSKMGSLVNMDNVIFTEKNMDGSMKFFIKNPKQLPRVVFLPGTSILILIYVYYYYYYISIYLLLSSVILFIT